MVIQGNNEIKVSNNWLEVFFQDWYQPIKPFFIWTIFKSTITSVAESYEFSFIHQLPIHSFIHSSINNTNSSGLANYFF